MTKCKESTMSNIEEIINHHKFRINTSEVSCIDCEESFNVFGRYIKDKWEPINWMDYKCPYCGSHHTIDLHNPHLNLESESSEPLLVA